ncbi:type IV pilin protein [Mesoterricola silvestris]|uniref:Prepilin-type N-terminal cleavage/methylation domain-containing protein n=1 Tax=Mesoterricola silvestris TaxID=2927979 RepID=A0AA48KCD1_9BACT|nr:type II secretion system protein [Mesoterricola silvestris]BDU73373.1 hypothetical protein METEAL_25470 [Mesoterricola silvestris]
MKRRVEQQGFSLVELLLVLAIIGIISAIAIPSFLGQRRRARVVGDAQANAAVLRMQLETRRADTGTYGSNGVTYTWTGTSAPAASTSPAPNFVVSKNTTKMNYSLLITGNGLSYVLTVTDPTLASAQVLTTNQNGSTVVLLH